jgi:hypothetical protein
MCETDRSTDRLASRNAASTPLDLELHPVSLSLHYVHTSVHIMQNMVNSCCHMLLACYPAVFFLIGVECDAFEI